MRLVSFSVDGERRFGAVEGDQVRDMTGWAGHGSLRSVFAAGALPILRGAVPHARDTHALDAVALLPPIPDPDKCVCVDANDPDAGDGGAAPDHRHDRPGLFLRLPGSFAGAGQPILCPRASPRLDCEGGVVLVIGRGGRHIPQDRALSHLAGLTLCNGGSVRHGRSGGTVWSKNFHRSGSMGPWMVTADTLDPAAPLTWTTRVNGEVRQRDSTDRLLFPFAALIHHVSTLLPLLPGDLIATATPAGAGLDPPRWLVPGDVVEVEAPGLGTLRNTVAEEA